eukprot:scaffold109257_cov34-Tisochrysis_lutea.AAC.2
MACEGKNENRYSSDLSVPRGHRKWPYIARERCTRAGRGAQSARGRPARDRRMHRRFRDQARSHA